MLNRDKHEAWTGATVAVILDLRMWALRDGIAKNKALTAWEMVSERTRLATRRSETVQMWVSTIMRALQIETVNVATAHSLIELAAVVGDDVDEWFAWIDAEHPFVFALAREAADRRKAEAKKTSSKSKPQPKRKRIKEAKHV